MADWLTPESLNEDCCLTIPWKRELIPHLRGAIQQMVYKSSWETFGAVSIEDVTQFVMGALAVMQTECGVTDIRVGANGKLQVKRGGSWVDANGDGGDTTVINNDETLIQEFYDTFERPEGATDDDIACSIAEGLSGWLADQFNASLDEIEVTTNEFVALTTITALFPPVYLILQPIATMIDNISELGVSVVRALFDSNAEEGMLCAIYCYLKVNGGVVTADNVGELKNEIANSMPTGLFGIWDNFMDGINNNALVARASFYMGGADIDCALLCADCGGCSLFDSSKPQWEITLGNLQLDGCFGTQGVYGSSGGGEVEIWLTMPSQVLFTKLTFRDTNVATGEGVKHSIAEVYNGETLVGTIFEYNGQGGASSCHLNVVDPINLVGTRLRLYENSPTLTIFNDITVCWDSI